MKIVTLIGSSTQRTEFEEQIKRLVSEGFCPITTGIYLETDNKKYNDENEFKEKLRLAHRKRVELADIIGIIRKAGGGIGADTLRELIYAHMMEKEIMYADEIAGDNK